MHLHTCAYRCCCSRYMTTTSSLENFDQQASICPNRTELFLCSFGTVHHHAAQGNCIHSEGSVLVSWFYSLVILLYFYTMPGWDFSTPSQTSSALLGHDPSISLLFLSCALARALSLANCGRNRGSDSASTFGLSPPPALPLPRPCLCPSPGPGGFPFLPPLLHIFVHDQYSSSYPNLCAD